MPYDWLIEIRTMSEKSQLRRQMYQLKRELKLRKTPTVPHLSLVYDFTPKISAYKVASITQETAKSYSMLEFSYKGWDLKKGAGGYVFGFKIEPSSELRDFRYDLYHNLKPYIYESGSARVFNSASAHDFWFHASIAYHLDENTAKRINRFINNDSIETNSMTNFFNIFGRDKTRSRIRPFDLDARVVRVPLLRAGKITYEYDAVIDKILNRREALSRRAFEQDKLKLLKKGR